MEQINRQHSSRRRAYLGALLLAAVATVAAADEVISQRVRVSDLNLDSVDGQRALVQRVNHAIEEVCTAASAVESSKLRQMESMQDCREKARGSVQLQLARRGLEFQLVASRH